MNLKKIVVANLAVFGVMAGAGVIFQRRLNKQMEAGRAAMQKPLPPIGEEYLKNHRAYFNRPDVKETNDYLDRFASDHPELNP